LFGEVFTYADLRLFMCLIRFDPVYVVHFKCNKKMIMNYPNLNKWVRRIYNDVTYKEGCPIKNLVNMKHIKDHYYKTHKHINPTSRVAKGPDTWWEEPLAKDA